SLVEKLVAVQEFDGRAAVATRFPSGVTSEIEPSVAETPVSARERADTPTVGTPDENSQRTIPFDHDDGAIPQDVVGVAAVTAGDSRMSRLTARVIAPTPTQVLGGRGSAQPRPTVVDVIDFPMSARASPSFWSKDEIDWSKDAGSRPKQVGPGFEETLDPLVPEPFSVRDEQSDHSVPFAYLERTPSSPPTRPHAPCVDQTPEVDGESTLAEARSFGQFRSGRFPLVEQGDEEQASRSRSGEAQ